ncbi:MAG: dihydroorotase [Clostridiales Family XIII bacterium]|jgi:dihydroorotase|nr:dihydroorotase [Clostridiales Family XIII bacterium]
MSKRRLLCPAFVDLHVHFRDPGFTDKEDIETGGQAAAAGGFRAVCCMPNTNPAIDSPDTLMYIDEKARRLSPVAIFAVGALTKGQAGKELADIEAMHDAPTLCRELTGHGICAISEDGRSLYDEDLMRQALLLAKKLNIPLMDHPEPEPEIVRRDIGLARETGARIHLQHISTAEAVDAVRQAKKEGVSITAETCPHYFALTKEAEKKFGANAKMNPPLGTERDRIAVTEALCDGTIDVIATDHAPHEAALKRLPFAEAPFGIIGLETAFPVSYTVLVKGGYMTAEDLIKLMSTNPAKIIGLRSGVGISAGVTGDTGDVTVDLASTYLIDSSKFRSKARNTPFEGMEVTGEIIHDR